MMDIDGLSRSVAQTQARGKTVLAGAVNRVHEDFWAHVDRRIEALATRQAPEVATVASVGGGKVAIAYDDAAGPGVVGHARVAGVQINPGDRIIVQRTRSGGRYVAGKLIAGTGAVEQVVGSSELIPAAVGSTHIAGGAVRSTHIGSGQVNDTHITGMSTSKLQGQVAAGQISGVNASAIQGQISGNQVSSISASQITGQLSSGQIPPIQAQTIQGQIQDGQIASVSASKLTGQIDASRISGLNFNAISGQISGNQIDQSSIRVQNIGGNWSLICRSVLGSC